MKVLFDTNVIIDALSDKGEYYNYSQKVLLLAANKQIKGFISSNQITDIYYILKKYYQNEEQKRAAISTLINVLEVLPLLPSNIKYCVNAKINDYEDALLDEIAKVNMIPYIVTNNIKDFDESKTVSISPKDLYTLMSLE